MSVSLLLFVTLIGSGFSQDLFNEDYTEDGAVQVIEDDPTADVSERLINGPVFQPFVDEGAPQLKNLTGVSQSNETNTFDVTLLNATSHGNKDLYDGQMNDGHCGYLMMKFLAMSAILVFLMIVILLVWFSCSASPHHHKFPASLVVTPNNRPTANVPGRNFGRF